MNVIAGESQAYIEDAVVQIGKLPLGDRLAPQEYSNQTAIVKAYVTASKRWLVKLQDPLFEGKQLLVPEVCLKFVYFATPPDLVPEQPSTIHIKSAGLIGKAVFAQTAFKKGKVIFTENPLMVVQNQNGYPSRLNLFYKTRDAHGVDSATMKAFHEFSDGGTTHRYKDEAKTLFLNMAGAHLKKLTSAVARERLVDEETSVIAGVLARWQSNGHLFPLRGHAREGNVRDNSLSALYRYVAKLNHSCEPNTRFDVDAGTGRMIVYALRAIKVGEELTSDYIGHGPAFRTMSVKDRRELIRPRGFVCMCTKCLRESREQMLTEAKAKKEHKHVGSELTVRNEKGTDFKIQIRDQLCEDKKENEAIMRVGKILKSNESESSTLETESTSFWDEDDTSEPVEGKHDGVW